MAPNPKTNPNPTPNPNRRAIFLGGQLTGCHEAYYDKSMKEKSYLISEFQNNLKYSGSGYEVKLPFIGENKTLPENYLLAKMRTGNLLKQLAKDDALLKSYDTIFKEYLQEGIIEKASNIPNEGYVHYLPHRPVTRNNRETSKIHIVFDASSKFKNEKSLIDVCCHFCLIFYCVFGPEN